MQNIGATGDGKSAVATPDGKKPKEEEGLWLRVGIVGRADPHRYPYRNHNNNPNSNPTLNLIVTLTPDLPWL